MKAFTSVLISLFVLVACGGGGSSSGGQVPAPPPAASAPGSISVLMGDAALDGVQAVIIDIEEVLLLSDTGQVTLTDGPIEDINLLDLRYITTLIADTEVPAGTYSKIRLRISSLQVIEEGNPIPEDVELPANGKIDLNPQGTFDIASGEDLVVQIDIDLSRSIKLHKTGSNKYRFRPVVFVNVLNQSRDFRLTRLFGELQADDDAGDGGAGDVSDYDLCTETNMDPCVDVLLAESARALRADGTPVEFENILVPEAATVFGHFEVNSNGDFFRALVIVLGNEDSIEKIDGEVTSVVEADAFDLTEGELTTRILIADALLRDGLGDPLAVEIGLGQEAEAWALSSLLDTAEEGVFPAFLVQVRVDDTAEEDSVEGVLVDITDNTLTLSEEGVESCVLVDDGTEFRLLSEYNSDATTDVISFIALGDLFEGGNEIEIEAFGALLEECLEADVVSAEVD